MTSLSSPTVGEHQLLLWRVGGGWLKEMGLRGGRGKAGLPNLLLAIIKYVYILTLFTISVDISCFKSC